MIKKMTWVMGLIVLLFSSSVFGATPLASISGRTMTVVEDGDEEDYVFASSTVNIIDPEHGNESGSYTYQKTGTSTAQINITKEYGTEVMDLTFYTDVTGSAYIEMFAGQEMYHSETVTFSFSGSGGSGGSTSSDSFSGAPSLSGSTGQVSGSNVGATKESGEPAHAGYPGGASVWWSWTATSDGAVSFDTFGSDFDTLLAVYTGTSVGALVEIAANDDDDVNDGFQSKVSFVAVAGTPYRIAVDGFGAATGSIALNWVVAGPPEKDLTGTWTGYGVGTEGRVDFSLDLTSDGSITGYNREEDGDEGNEEVTGSYSVSGTTVTFHLEEGLPYYTTWDYSGTLNSASSPSLMSGTISGGPAGGENFSLSLENESAQQLPDLVIQSTSLTSETVEPGELVSLNVETKNVGEGDADPDSPGYFETALFLNTEDNFEGMSYDELDVLELSGTGHEFSGMDAGRSSTKTHEFTAPSEPGTYYIRANVDHFDSVAESDEENNFGELFTLVVNGSFSERMVVIPKGSGVNSFLMDETEVPKILWDEVYNWAVENGYSFDNAGGGKTWNHPVCYLNWYDCIKWCNARSEMEEIPPCYNTTAGDVYREGRQEPLCSDLGGYRLPTTAEYEYAARGGLSGMVYPWGNTASHSDANFDSGSATSGSFFHPDYAVGNRPFTSPVGSFSTNNYGLFDIAGNVREWCWNGSASQRAMKGGDWYYYRSHMACSYVHMQNSGSSDDQFGFRTVRSTESDGFRVELAAEHEDISSGVPGDIPVMLDVNSQDLSSLPEKIILTLRDEFSPVNGHVYNLAKTSGRFNLDAIEWDLAGQVELVLPDGVQGCLRIDDVDSDDQRLQFVCTDIEMQEIRLCWGYNSVGRVVQPTLFEAIQSHMAGAESLLQYKPVESWNAFDFSTVLYSSGENFSILSSNIYVEVRRAFVRQGIGNILVDDGAPNSESINVFFVDQSALRVVDSTTKGFAYTLVGDMKGDRLNTRKFDCCAIGLRVGDPQAGSAVAEDIIHETGHLVGLRHIKQDTGEKGWMVQRDPGSDMFVDDPVPSNAGEFPLMTQNSLFHIRRYVTGESEGVLTAHNLNPGSWDKLVFDKKLVSVVAHGLNNLRLKSAQLLIERAYGEESSSQLLLLEEYNLLSFDELGAVMGHFYEGGSVLITAQSEGADQADLVLSLQPLTDSIAPSKMTSGSHTVYCYQVEESGNLQLVDTGTLTVFVDTDQDHLPDADEQKIIDADPNDDINSLDDVLPTQDSDGDGLTNAEEVQLGTNMGAEDSDNDGLTDGQEVSLGTDPHRPDTDGDGMSDGWEVTHQMNPTSASDAAEDDDNDGLTNIEEYSLGTNPSTADTDGDGVKDDLEVRRGTDPLDPADKPALAMPWLNLLLD